MPKPKTCPRALQPQTILFPRDRFTVTEARAWLRKHGHKATKVDRQQHTLRFRQRDPRTCRKDNYVTIPMGATGIKLVLCCPAT